MAATADREQALATALQQIEKQHGKGSVMRLGEQETVKIAAIPTGSVALDVALGVGGLPRGRIVEIYGPESSGKTTVALHAIANAQAEGGICAFIDAEHALDPEYARKLGVDTDSLLVSQPDNGEQALEIADTLVRSGALELVVIDSVAALTPKAEIEGEMGDSHVGLQARLMSQALRKMTGALNAAGTTAIFINQLREKIGVMFGSPETTTGGRALKFYSSVRLDVRRIETLKDGSSRPSSTFSMVRAFPEREASSTWAWTAGSSPSPDRGSVTAMSSWVRVRRMSATSSRATRTSPTRSRTRSSPTWVCVRPKFPRESIPKPVRWNSEPATQGFSRGVDRRPVVRGSSRDLPQTTGSSGQHSK